MSNGETTGSATEPTPKKRGFGALKEKFEAESAELHAEIAALKAKLAAAQAVEITAPVTTTGSTTIDASWTNTATSNGYDPTTDPLGWIDESVDEIHLVSRNHTLPGHTINRHRGLKVGQDVGYYLRCERRMPWVKSPFRFRGTHQQVSELRAMTRDFAHYTVDRTWAESVFSYPKNPMPTKAVVLQENYRGVNDTTMQPAGAKTPCSTDPLREYVRHLLQTHPGRLWIDKAYHMEEERLDELRPNPYSDSFHIVSNVQTEVGPPLAQSDVIGDVILRDRIG